MTIAWFHCFSGIAGDMALGALLDAGADLDEVRALVARLGVGNWTLDAEHTQANYANGILRVQLARGAEAPKKIPIQH